MTDRMRIVFCTNRKSLSQLISKFLNREVDFFQSFSIDDNLLDHIYKINPDIILFDFSSKGNKKWKFIKNLTLAPSLREIPLILILREKMQSQFEKICEFDIFDYLIENFHKCELLMKIHKAREIIEIKKEYNKLLTKDPLTGAYNRRFLIERIQEEIS